MKLEKSTSGYSRTTVKNDKKNIYIFTDNCNRTSGTRPIPNDSEYSKRFGMKDLCYPTVTSAVIRGLDNAYPVTTQRWYKKGAKPSDNNWTDDDFEEFKKIIDDDFEVIKKACIKKKPDVVFFPQSGILNSNIANITYVRCPKLYKYIIEKEIELRDFKVE